MQNEHSAKLKLDFNIAECEKAIGITFNDKDLLRLSMTHASYDVSKGNAIYGDNERLEFLGDRVLGLVIASQLFEKHKLSSEGDLALYFNALVRKETCTKVAYNMNLDQFVLLGTSEQKSSPRRKQAILGNLIEALIGAIYLDQGFASAEKFINEQWGPLFDLNEKPMRDAKTALQEWAQARALPVPDYVEKDRSGPDHAPVFTIEVTVKGYDRFSAKASSKRSAQQEAARKFLVANNIWEEE